MYSKYGKLTNKNTNEKASIVCILIVVSGINHVLKHIQLKRMMVSEGTCLYSYNHK